MVYLPNRIRAKKVPKYMKYVLQHRQELIVAAKYKKSPFSNSKVKHILSTMIKATPFPDFDASIIFVGNKLIRERNRIDREVDEVTDILSYPFADIKVPGVMPKDRARLKVLGDMLIAVPYVLDYCQRNALDISDHIATLIAHGLCHLMGYDHQTDAEKIAMEREERKLLDHWEKNKHSGFNVFKIGPLRRRVMKKYNFMNFEKF